MKNSFKDLEESREVSPQACRRNPFRVNVYSPVVKASKSLFFLLIFACLGLTSCTIAINQNHTEGTASDLVDETQTNDPNVSPTVSIPAPIKFSAHQGATAPKNTYIHPPGANSSYVNKQQYPKRHRQKSERPDWTD